MRKLFAVILSVIMLFAFSSCASKAEKANTVGTKLLAEFKTLAEENPDAASVELADALITNEMIPFMGGAMSVEPGLLTGFGNAEITGFREGALFGPMISTLPFIGYVFTLEDGADADAFMKTLETNADPRWNICTEAEETVIGHVGNKVFFIMCPAEFEE